MSYRLIDSNDLALKYPEVNDMPCIYADLPNELDDGHYVLEPSRKGHWIENRKYRHENFSLWTCSECTYEVNSAYDLSYFCPNCGADMRGAE